MSMSKNISISEPSLAVPLSSLEPKNDGFRTKDILIFAVGIIMLAGGAAAFYFLSKGISPHSYNVISHAIGTQWTQIFYQGSLALAGIGISSIFLGSRNLFMSSVSGEYLHLHLREHIRRIRPGEADKFRPALIGKTTNVPKASLLGGGSIRSTFLQMRQNFVQEARTALEGEIFGSGHPDFIEARKHKLDQLEAYEKKEVGSTEILKSSRNGICFGYVLTVAKRILNGEPIESQIQRFSGGGDEEMTALQFLYHTVPQDIMYNPHVPIAALGLQASSSDTLDEEGVYYVSMDFSFRQRHSILVQVRGDDVFVLDPNYFLIRFDKSAFQDTMQQFLGLYYAAAQKIPVEAFDFKSLPSHFVVQKLALNTDSSARYGIVYQKDQKDETQSFLVWDTLPED